MSSIRRDLYHFPPNPESSLLPCGCQSGISRRAELSIVVPAKDESGNLPQLVEEIVLTFRPLVGRPVGESGLDGFEVLIVDDGSTDRTAEVLRPLMASHPELRTIPLVRSFGQSAATIAGIRAARGDWVGLLDADLQNPPADLAALWGALPGFDAALGWRRTREDDWTKRLVSRLANRVRNAVFRQSIRDTGCSVRIIPRDVALRLPTFHGVHRFFGPLLLREGCRIVQMPVTHRPRTRGKSHYHFGNRSVRVVVDLLGVAWLLRRPIRYEVAPAPVAHEPSIFTRSAVGREAAR